MIPMLNCTAKISQFQMNIQVFVAVLIDCDHMHNNIHIIKNIYIYIYIHTYMVALILPFKCYLFYRQKRSQRIMVCIYHLLMAVLVNFWMKKDCLQIMLYKAMFLN